MVDISNNIAPRSHNTRHWKKICYYVFLAIALIYIGISGVIASVAKEVPEAKRTENEQWVASSRFWLDRQLCRWIGCCGTLHMLNHAGWVWSDRSPLLPPRDYREFWHAGTEDPDRWSHEERARRTIPQYVFDYAPYVHLFSRETYWPSDVAEHLDHVTPYINHTKLDDLNGTLDLANLNSLNNITNGEAGKHIYLRSDENIETLPDWLRSDYNIPPHSTRECHRDTARSNGQCGGSCNMTCQGSAFGNCCSIWGWCGSDEDYCAGYCNPLFGKCYGPAMTGKFAPHRDLKKRSEFTGGQSGAPAILVVVPKDDGIVDAFWFFFYSYNQGKRVLHIRFGNHVGDWEHTMIRFQHGVPYQAFLSAHSWGAAYSFKALEKYAPDPHQYDSMLSSWKNASDASNIPFKRPVVFSADGSHAMYPTPNFHSYVAPFGILHDDTDRGPLWDPALNAKSFTYNHKDDTIRSSTLNPDAPTEWFDYSGHWGDRYYLLSDPRQYRFAGEYHYVNGPLGPKFKNLGREHACINPGPCEVRQ